MDTLTVSALVDELARRNIQVSADGERLHLDGPAGSLTPELRERLIEHKAGLLTHLRNPDADERENVDHSQISRILCEMAELPKLTKSDEHPVNVAVDLEQAIRQAQDWESLETALESAQLLFQAGELSAETVEQLAILAAQEAHAMPEPAEGLRLSELFREQPIRRVYSKILAEVVVFAADGADVPADTPGIVYRASELRHLVACPPEHLRRIHAVKHAFDGELIR